MKGNQDVTLQIAAALEACGISYLLAGSFSSNYYGIPRSTKDADFVVQLRGGLGPEVIARLGGDFEAEPQLSFETNTGTYRQLIRHTRSAFHVELFQLSDD